MSSINVISPCIHIYENAVDFSGKIIDIISNDQKSWIIKNQDATNWKPGDKILGYDEYPIYFNFFIDQHFLLLGKNIFDNCLNYAEKNLTTINNFDSCIIRKYSAGQAFLEIESPDTENSSRKITSILALNNYKGEQQIKFKNFDVEANLKAGDLLIFPSSFAYSFKINKPVDEKCFVVVSHFVKEI